MAKQNQKKPNIGLIIGVILFCAIVVFGLFALIATPLISNLVTTARDRACCIDAGGEWNSDTGDCIDIEHEERYNDCLEGEN